MSSAIRKRRARGALPPQPDVAVFDARPTKSLARLLGYDRCAVYSVVSNGDCLYRAVYEFILPAAPLLIRLCSRAHPAHLPPSFVPSPASHMLLGAFLT